MNQLSQTLVSGLISGCVYGWVALALSLTYCASGLVNFATGSLVMLGGFAYIEAAERTENRWLALVITAVTVAIVSGLFKAVLSRDVSVATLQTLALFIVFEGVAAVRWGNDRRSGPGLINDNSVSILGARVSVQGVLVVVLFAIGAVGVVTFFRFSPMGWVFRAIAESPSHGSRLGINVQVMGVAALLASGVFAGAAGALVAPITGVSPTSGGDFLTNGIAAFVIGGMARPAGALLGGVVLGIAGALGASYVSSLLGHTIGLLIVIIVLIVRPEGLLRGGAKARA